MDLNFHNSLSGKKEVFKPLNPERVTLYHCGPTVYDYVHVGNLRSFIFADTLRRALEYVGFKVEQTINITDVGHLSGDVDEGEDKMSKGLNRENLPFTMEAMHTLGTKYMEAFESDLQALNILKPQHMPRASDSVYISEDLNLIQKLLAKGLAYETADGIYFDTENFPNYGALPGLPRPEELKAVPHPNKKNSRDFSLWKKNSEYGFESPYGKGFPGWHIECSAMSMRTLQTETLDIHTGGIDLAPIHHNNEIAQSEGATGKKFANFFMHSAFVDFEGGKMAKSKGNIVRLKDVLEKGYHPLALRYLFLTAHYKTPIDFTLDALRGAEQALEKIIHNFALFGETKENQKLISFLADDLNTPQAIAEISTNGLDIEFVEKVLGLPISTLAEKVKDIPIAIKQKIEERDVARNEKEYQKSDTLRDEIVSMGYALFDTPTGTRVLKNLSTI
ncbi:MAG: cysteine--tRNA ligase [Minisyncoccia bacterium]